MSLRILKPIWASKSKDDSEVVDQSSVSFRRYGVKRVRSSVSDVPPPLARHEKHSCACSSVPRSRPPSPPRAPAHPLLQVSTLKLLPSRTISRLYGAVNNFTL
jgi:hypothetical protein